MLPLADVRIVAVEQYGAGPWGTLQLADLYSITVGFENGTGGPAPTGRKTRKKKTSG